MNQNDPRDSHGAALLMIAALQREVASTKEAYAEVKAWAGVGDLAGEAGPYLDGYNIARQHAREMLKSMQDYDVPAPEPGTDGGGPQIVAWGDPRGGWVLDQP
jgi:hypothetical protein